MAKSKKIKDDADKSKAVLVANSVQINARIILASCFALVLLCLVTYVYSMTSGYVFNDAHNYATIIGIKDKSTYWGQLLFSGLEFPLSLPWLQATYALDIGSFGYEAGWAHAANIVLHIFSVVYLYFFTFRVCCYLKEIGKSKLNPYHCAGAAAALLACHPLTTGSIAYISGRSGVLGGCNYFLALNCLLFGYLQEDLFLSILGYIGFVISVLIGVTANLECLTLPVVGLALIAILKPATIKAREYVSERIIEIVLLGILTIVLAYMLRFEIPPQIDNGFALPKPSATIYCATQFKALLLYYFRFTLIPFGMAIFPPVIAMRGWSDPATIAGVVALTLVGGAGLVQKSPLVRIGTTIFLLTLLPWLFLVQRELVADSRFYIPLAGLCIAASVGVVQLSTKNFFRVGCAFVTLLVVFVGLSIYRENEFSSNLKLWQSEVKKDPDNARNHANLAEAYIEVNKSDDAKKEANSALKLNADDFTAHIVKGSASAGKKNENEVGLAEFKRAVEIGETLGVLDSQLAPYRVHLAKSYYAAKKFPEAYEEASKASAFITTDGVLLLIDGKHLLAEGKPLQALKSLEDGMKLEPKNNDFLIPIATAALDSGMVSVRQHAYAAAKRALQFRPGAEANKLYLRACLAYGRPDEARKLLDNALKAPKVDNDYVWIAAGYESQEGHKEVAEKLRKEALTKDPTLEKRMKLNLYDPAAKSVVPAVVMPNK